MMHRAACACCTPGGPCPADCTVCRFSYLAAAGGTSVITSHPAASYTVNMSVNLQLEKPREFYPDGPIIEASCVWSNNPDTLGDPAGTVTIENDIHCSSGYLQIADWSLQCAVFIESIDPLVFYDAWKLSGVVWAFCSDDDGFLGSFSFDRYKSQPAPSCPSTGLYEGEVEGTNTGWETLSAAVV